MDKISELKATALAATPGPWELIYDDWSDGDDALISSESRNGMVAIAKIEGGGEESGYDESFSSEQQANAAFIAAANPAVVLALLAELEARDKRIAELEAKLANREVQPVAWQYRYSSLGLVGEWKTVQDELLCNTHPEYERRPIFTAPPAVPDYKLNSPVIPNGWKLVPSQPTEEMVAAAMLCDDIEFNSDETFCVNLDNIYEAMLAAAPENTPSHGLHQEQPSP